MNDPSQGELVNNGAWYPANFDKPHDFTFVGNYKFSRRFSTSLNCTYSTGRPVTLPIATYNMAGGQRIVYGDRNQHRIPDYFRIDLSLNIEGNHKIKKLSHSSWTIAVYNLTGRKTFIQFILTMIMVRYRGISFLYLANRFLQLHIISDFKNHAWFENY